MKRRKQWCLIIRMLKKYMCTALDLHVQRWPSVLSLRFIAIWNIPVEGRVDVELLLLSMAAIKHHFMINRDKMNMHDHDKERRVEILRINDEIMRTMRTIRWYGVHKNKWWKLREWMMKKLKWREWMMKTLK